MNKKSGVDFPFGKVKRIKLPNVVIVNKPTNKTKDACWKEYIDKTFIMKGDTT